MENKDEYITKKKENQEIKAETEFIGQHIKDIISDKNQILRDIKIKIQRRELEESYPLVCYMKNYVMVTRVTGVLSIIFFFSVIIIHYQFSPKEVEILENICLAIFGSALLTCATSITTYITEKKNVLERFSYSTHYLLDKIKKYDVSWTTGSKIDFLLGYVDIDKSMWELQFNEIYFMNDFCKKKIGYISAQIYTPIQNFNKEIEIYKDYLRLYKDDDSEQANVNEMISNIEKK